MTTFPLGQHLKTQLSHLTRPSRSSPKALPIENSAPLRVAVQALVSVGILATDLAAGTTNSLWAVPLSALGATWSWHHRHQRNLGAKLGIALGMLVVLGLFLSRLVGQMGDSRIVLAELLIQLQVLHTFDLPRRKDLGYSAVIGIILLGVAATVSETTVFGGMLVLFLAIALPVLLLDYRSRLGLESLRLQQVGKVPKQLGVILVIVMALGLLIFALMPRLPGYQLRTFPVSGPIDVQGQFDGQQVINPGYVKGNSSDRTQTDSDGANQTFAGQAEKTHFDSKSYYGFNEEIDQNLRGTLDPQVVMRVRSQSQGFWRVLAFDHYTGQGWKLSRNDQVNLLKRPSWSYRFAVPQRSQLGATREVVQTYSIQAEFTNLIPVLLQPRHLFFPTREVAIDPEGGLRSPVSLNKGLTYTVISDVPYRDRNQLGTASTDYSEAIREHYLQIPTAIAEQVQQQTEAILAKAPHQPTAPYEKALFLTQALKQNYALQLDLPPLAKDADLVESFLFKFEGGYPDHFSTTLTIMLRSIGIPARLVTGLGPGQFNPFTGMYVVKNTDAYAMTEVYFPKFGWFAFDPIPGHDLIPPSVEVDQTFSVLRQFWHWVAGWLPSPITGILSGVAATVVTALGRLLGLLTTGWSGMITGLLICTGGGLLGWLGWHGWRWWRYRSWLVTLPPMERLYRRMLGQLAAQGIDKRPAQTPLEYLHQVKQTVPAVKADIVTQITQAYLSWRYGGQSVNLPYLRQQLRQLRRQQRAQVQNQRDGCRV